MILLQQIQNRFQSLLTQWVGEIKAETQQGQNDKKVISEVVLVGLLREMYGYEHLKNMNSNAGFNYPGIDLADQVARVAIQVTATSSATKILNTLEKFVKFEQYKSFDRLIVYILTEKQKSYISPDLLAKFEELKQKRLELGLEPMVFDLKRDVWDSSNLLNDMAPMQVEHAEHVLQVLESNFELFQIASSRRWKPLENPDARFGGQDKLDAFVTALLEGTNPILVLGLAGIGKSNLCQHGLDHLAVQSRFGSRRAFVRCDAATNRDNLVAQIASEIRVVPGPALELRVLAELEHEPCVIVLDNLKTPWNADPLPVENLLSVLVGLPGLALVAGVRGGSRPVGPRWVSIQPEALSDDDARAFFLEFSERKFASDPNLDGLLGLGRLDGLPLAIKILASLAQGDPDLSGLLRRYDAKRSALLNQGPDKARSLPVSLELSFESPRMNDLSRVGASVLALLPDGVQHSDLNNVLEDGDEVAHTLRSVGLVFDREGRLRMLAPVREHVALAHPANGTGFERAVRFYCGLVLEHGYTVAREGGAQAVERLGPEVGNASEMVLRALEVDEDLAVRAAIYLGEFAAWTGYEAVRVLTLVLESAPDDANVPTLIRNLGEIALRRSDHDDARARFEQALPLFQRVGDVLGEASCIRSLGEIALARSDHDAARVKYLQALELYGHIPDPYSMGTAHLLLFRIARDDTERDHHIAQAGVS